MSKRLARRDWPEDLRTRWGVKGVAVGGCTNGRRISRHYAHTHTTGFYKGWICFAKTSDLENPDLVKHELAHLISGQGHTKKFREVLRDLGGDMTHYSERERTAARGIARHRWEGPEYGDRKCRRCGVTKMGQWPNVSYYRGEDWLGGTRPDCG